LLARGSVFVATVADHGFGSVRRPAVQGRDRLDERDQLTAVGAVAGSEPDRERDAARVGD
jgi:hypothetical protein